MNWRVFLFNILLCSIVLTSTTQAAIRVKGYVSPSDPAEWTSSTYALIGYNHTSGTVAVSGGTAIQSRKGYLGWQSDSPGFVTITGAQSQWIVGSQLGIGRSGNGRLTIANGGHVESTASAISQYDESVSEAFVYGADSLWTNQYHYIGYRGTATLSITNGGTVTNEYTTIGYYPSATATVTVSGETSSLINTSDYFEIGNSGTGIINVIDGGYVASGNAYIGHNASGNGDVSVSGEGSRLSCSNSLTIGNKGTGKLTISNGGQVAVGVETFIEAEEGSSGSIHFDQGTLATGILLGNYDRLSGNGTINTRGMVTDDVLVFDSPESLNQSFQLQSATQDIALNLSVDETSTIGAGYETQGEISISNGTTLISKNSYFGYKADSIGNCVVSGPTTSWTNSALTSIGHEGTGFFSISDGALVNSDYTRIGHLAGSSGTATISGADTRWIVNGTLTAGYNGEGSLDVSDNAALEAQYLTICRENGSQGEVSISSGASAIITNGCSLGVEEKTQGFLSIHGGSSSWQNAGQLKIGRSGEGYMNITNGASATDLLCIIGCNESSTGQALVSGLDSIWTIATDLTVGDEGNASLIISDGATVFNENCWIGKSEDSSGSVSVTGIDSFWINSGDLTIGEYGFGSLDIVDGGTVMLGGSLTMNQHTNATSYIQMSSGGTLAWAGDNDYSIEQFMGYMEGMPVIQYWNGTEWDAIFTAIRDLDYTLEYMTDGDYAGYTLLTVGTIPEPATVAILILGAAVTFRRR